MYIEPNTNIKILKNVPLDTTYKNTLYFESISSQISYFTSLKKHELVNQSYQRVQKGISRVSLSADVLYDCNYMMFQNTSYGNKWFYAFINEVEYINNGTSQITFEIDVMQTWFFDYMVMDCLVEREHSVTDVIGENTVPEKLEHGEWVSKGTLFSEVTDMDLSVVIATTFNLEGEYEKGGYYGGVYSGLKYYKFTKDQTEALNDFLWNINDSGLADGIISIFMMPEEFATGSGLPIRKTVTKNYDTLKDGYAPKNKKLFTYPYNFLSVYNGNGVSAEYCYEHFDNKNDDYVAFYYFGDMTPNPSVLFYPVSYKGLALNYEEGLLMDGFPQCAFNTDLFKAWLAQNGSSLGLSALSATTALVGGAIAGSYTGDFSIAISGVTQASNLISQVYNHTVLPPQARGNQSSGINVALDRKNFHIDKITIKKEYAEIIDNYFSMYGYATHRVKKPNRNSRPYWNFVKTVGATIKGSVPSDDMKKINSIYDTGVTFWKNGNNVGNYSLNNSPT